MTKARVVRDSDLSADEVELLLEVGFSLPKGSEMGRVFCVYINDNDGLQMKMRKPHRYDDDKVWWELQYHDGRIFEFDALEHAISHVMDLVEVKPHKIHDLHTIIEPKYRPSEIQVETLSKETIEAVRVLGVDMIRLCFASFAAATSFELKQAIYRMANVLEGEWEFAIWGEEKILNAVPEDTSWTLDGDERFGPVAQMTTDMGAELYRMQKEGLDS